MSDEENIVLGYLQSNPSSAFARREIARRAVKRIIYEQNPRWVDAPLASLVGRQLVIIDEGGNYRLKGTSVLDKK